MNEPDVQRAARLAGLELDAATDLRLEGEDPVLPSPLRLGLGASTALALVGQEAATLWELRGGAAQRLAIDVRHAAASLRSYLWLRFDGTEPRFPPRAGARLTAVWPCRDGRYIHLHGSFRDAPRTLALLGLPGEADADAIARATARWDAFELEEELARRGLCGAVCRTPEEWAAHPQGQALAPLPVVEVRRIGDAPPRPLPPAERPLEGVRVLDLTRVLAGPTCARTLAEHGATVRHVAAPNLPLVPLFEIDTGHWKHPTYLDASRSDGAARLRELLRGADVFSQGFRLGVMERLGFGPAELARAYPGIVYVSINAYGHVGPWRGRPGWEQLAQAATGVTVVQAEGTGTLRPTLAPAALNDYTTGYFAAVGAMIALRRRASEGGSWLVTASLAHTSMWYLRLGTLHGAPPPERLDATPYLATRPSAWGELTYLRPALRMSETPPGWELAPQPLGSGAARWPA